MADIRGVECPASTEVGLGGLLAVLGERLQVGHPLVARGLCWDCAWPEITEGGHYVRQSSPQGGQRRATVVIRGDFEGNIGRSCSRGRAVGIQLDWEVRVGLGRLALPVR